MDKSELCFIKRFDKNTVCCYFFDLKELRSFTVSPLFKNMRLFIGKNIEFKTYLKDNTIILTCVEMKTKKLRQLWNYYILGKFKLKKKVCKKCGKKLYDPFSNTWHNEKACKYHKPKATAPSPDCA